MSTKRQARKARERREREGLTMPMAKKLERECGTCSLCKILDCPRPRSPIRCGVMEFERPDDRSRVGLRFLHPDNGVAPGCLWLRGIWSGKRDTRPDRTGIVPAMMTLPGHKPTDLILFVDPRHPNSYDRGRTRRLIRVAIGQGRTVYINDGSGRLKFARMEARQ